MLLAEQDGVGVPIELEGQVVVVVEWVVHHHFLMDPPWQMVCSCVDTFLVVPVPCHRERYQLLFRVVVSAVHLASALGSRSELWHFRRE